MPLEPSVPEKRRSAWILTAIACAAMLLLPAIAWLVMPRPPPPKPLPRAIATAAPPSDDEPAPPPRADRAPHPVAPASAAPDDNAPVTGTVLDPDGRPAARAFVGCEDRSEVLAATSDDDGHFRLGPDAAGCHAVASHPAFITSDRVELVAGRDNVIRLNRGGAIEGEVVDDRGAPVAAYQLAIESYQGASAETSPLGQVRAINDAQGAFLWDNLAPGTYVLTASGDARPPARSRSIEVETNRTTRHVRIVLARGGTLTGRVVDADTKKPLANASVALDALTSAGVGGGGWVATDESGAYTLEGAPPGLFSVRVAHDGYVTKTISGLTLRGADKLQKDVELRPRTEGGPQNELGGIGAMLAPSPTGVVVANLVSGGPAEKAGLRPGDLLKRIDGEDASALPMSDCVQRLRGAEGSIVTVQVEREGRRVEVSIVRKTVSR